MILSVEELKNYITTDEEDQVLKDKLSALEILIRAYTNNNFQVRPFRSVAVAVSDGNQLLTTGTVPFKVGDTLQITESELQNNILVTVSDVSGNNITVAEDLYDESGVVITKVVYPADIKVGVANLMKWDLNNRDNIGVQSETISRHSVTYFNMDANNTAIGYPVSLVGFLKPYMKARFGRGIRR